MSRHLLFVLFLLLFGGYAVFGQCSGSLYFKDGDGDGFGTNDINAADIATAQVDFNDARDGQTVYYGNIAYGCSIPAGYVSNSTDCNDSDDDVWRNTTWYTDEDGDGAYGTYNSGCQLPPANSSPTRNDCDDGNKNG